MGTNGDDSKKLNRILDAPERKRLQNIWKHLGDHSSKKLTEGIQTTAVLHS